MANSYAIATSIAPGRNRVYDANISAGGGMTLSFVSVAADVDQQWDIFLDTPINTLAVPAKPTITNATTGGSIGNTIKIYARITAQVTDATQPSGFLEGQPCIAGATVTTGATATNKITVTWTAVSGATNYNIYLGTSQGYEAYAGTFTGTTASFTSLPVDLSRGVPTMPDISVKGAANTTIPLAVGGQSILVAARVTVYCTVTGSTSGTAYFSMIGA